jgi:hypothetical protein
MKTAYNSIAKPLQGSSSYQKINSSQALMYTKLVEIQMSDEIFRNYLTK